MKKFILITLGIIGILIGIAMVLAAFHPDSYSVSRSRTIQGSPLLAYGKIANLRYWSEWSPWAPMDSAAVYTFGQTTTGPGASMHWEGKKVGVGTLTFKEVIPFEKIVYDLSFEAPFKSKSEGTFLFSMNNNQLTVEWQDHGNLPYPFGRLLDMIWSFDELIGRDFEIGLSRLDSVTGRLPRYQLEEFHIVMLPGSTYLTMPISTQIPKVSDELHNGYNALYETAAALGLSPAGGGVCFYHVWDETGVEMEPALPLMQTNISEENLPEGFKIKQIPDQEALRIVYTGYPDAIGSAYEALEMFMDAFGYSATSGPIEQMGLNELSSADNIELWIYWPVSKN